MSDSRSQHSKLSPLLVGLMATTCALAVANLYYNQALLELMAVDFDAPPKAIGWIPTLTQVGYAAGILFIVPLGDRLERRRLIVTLLVVTALSLTGAALSPNLIALVVASFILGVTTVVAQVILPFAAHLAGEGRQGAIVGTLMSGVFLGILLARTFSGIVGDYLGWRSVYAIAAGMMLVLGMLTSRWLPQSQPPSKEAYGELLRSLFILARTQPLLQEAGGVQGMLFGAFSAFWATVAYLLAAPPYNFSAREVGLLGLVGIIGSFVSPIVGRLADRYGIRALRRIVGAGILLCILAYTLFWLFGDKRWGLILGTIALNLGTQGGFVANQNRVYRLLPAARSRLNTIYMFVTFIGAAIGSLLGSYGWELGEWSGVCAFSLAMLAAGGLYFLSRR